MTPFSFAVSTVSCLRKQDPDTDKPLFHEVHFHAQPSISASCLLVLSTHTTLFFFLLCVCPILRTVHRLVGQTPGSLAGSVLQACYFLLFFFFLGLLLSVATSSGSRVHLRIVHFEIEDNESRDAFVNTVPV